MVINKYRSIGYFILIIILFVSLSFLFFYDQVSVHSGSDSETYSGHLVPGRNRILTIWPDAAYPGQTVTIWGNVFETSPGSVVITGLRTDPVTWSDTEITFQVPEEAASGFVYIRNAYGHRSNKIKFTVKRDLPPTQIEPYNLEIADTGMLGQAIFVETDGDYLYGMTGCDTLTTYDMTMNPYEICSRFYFPQRVGDMRIHRGYLYFAGDMGLWIYRCRGLQRGYPMLVAAIANGSYIAVDIKDKTGIPIDGTLVSLCEYLPRYDSDTLHVPFYQFELEELVKLGSFSRSGLTASERQHAIALDPLNPKVYVSGFVTLLGNDKYILEIDISDPSTPILNHREESGGVLLFDMETRENKLWAGIHTTGTESFRVYHLLPGTDHLVHDQSVNARYMLGKTTRVKILDDSVTVGSSWLGERPDVFLMDTFVPGSAPDASINSIDWAFDLAGFAKKSGGYDGKIFVANEWGGFLTYNYKTAPDHVIEHETDYNMVPGLAWPTGWALTDDRLFMAVRGSGVWSADRYNLSKHEKWKSVPWEWSLSEPQPHPVSSLCIKEDPVHGTLIMAAGHDKAFAWADKEYGILYRESTDEIELLAISPEVDPPGNALLFSGKTDIIWPEPDLVYMTTGGDGFRALVVDPHKPRVYLHHSSRMRGFGFDEFGTTSRQAECLKYYDDAGQKRIIASGDPGLFIYSVEYPQGMPDREFPKRNIRVTYLKKLDCLDLKQVGYIDMTPSGLVAVATSQGVGVFHISWVDALNALWSWQAWNKIRIPVDTCKPWWVDTWSASFRSVSFADEDTLFAVKQHEGLWKLELDINWVDYTHTSTCTGYYPGINGGMNYTLFLDGWGNPDITTLHHPQSVLVDGGDVYVTGWLGKVRRIRH